MTFQSNRPRKPRRRAGLIALTVVLGALLGAFLARTLMPPRSTAEARLVVGDQTLSAQAVPGYATATQQLATTYARLVSSDEVTGTVSGDVTSVEATAIADSAIIRVQATATTDRAALAGARAGAQRLIDVAKQARRADSAATSMADYNSTYRTFQTATRQLSDAKARHDQGAVDEAQRRVARLQLTLNAYSAVYQQQVAANDQGSASITTFTRPALVKQQALRLPLLGALLGGFTVAALWALGAMVLRARRAGGDPPEATGATALRSRAAAPWARHGRDDARERPSGLEDSITLPDRDTPTTSHGPVRGPENRRP